MPYLGMCGQGKGGVSEATPCVGGGKAGRSFRNHTHVGGARRGVFQHTSHIGAYAGGAEVGIGNNALCGRGKTGASEATPYVGTRRKAKGEYQEPCPMWSG